MAQGTLWKKLKYWKQVRSVVELSSRLKHFRVEEKERLMES